MAVQNRVGDPNNPLQADEGLLVNFIPAKKIGAVAKIS
jgi:hypothetical protein